MEMLSSHDVRAVLLTKESGDSVHFDRNDLNRQGRTLVLIH
jgi:hypothetical protein